MTSNAIKITSDSMLTPQESISNKNLENNTNSILPSYFSIESAEQRKKDLLERYSGPRTKVTPTGIKNLICSECGEDEACTFAYDPEKAHLLVHCPRENKCGCKKTHRELFPREPFQDWYKKKVEIEVEVPLHHKATFWLGYRGIPKEIILNVLKPGVDYFQDKINGRDIILFPLADGTSKNGRFLDEQSPKSHNIGSTRGSYYKIQEYTYDPSKPVYVAESPLKAIALISFGLQAVAFPSANIPADNDLYKDFKDFTLCGAFDNDEAGIKATKALNKRVKELGLKEGVPILPPVGKDWDEILPFMEMPEEFLTKHFKKYEAYGAAALAKTPQEYTKIHQKYEKEGIVRKLSQVFIFNGNTCGWKTLKEEQDRKASQLFKGTLLPLAIFATKQGENSVGTENIKHTFAYEYISEDNKSRKFVEFEASDFKPSNFSSALKEKTGVALEVTNEWVLPIEKHLGRLPIKEVEKLSFSGVHFPTNSFLTPGWSINGKGELIFPNACGAFEVEKGRFLRPEGHGLFNQPPKNFKTKEERRSLVSQFVKAFIEAYPQTGALHLTHLAISFLVEPIKRSGLGVPFLSFTGEPGSGKTDRCKILLSILGITGSGPKISSTRTAGLLRSMSQTRGMPLFFDETNEDGEEGSNIDKKNKEAKENFKNLYKEDICQTQGRKDNSNKTQSNKCFNSFWFASNSPIFYDEASKQRTISFVTTREDLTEESQKSFELITNLISGLESPQLIGIALLELVLCPLIKNWKAERDLARIELKGIRPDADKRIIDDFGLILGANRIILKELESQDLSIENTTRGLNIIELIDAQMIEIRRETSPFAGELFNTLVEMGAIREDSSNYRGSDSGKFHTWVTPRSGTGEALFFYLSGYLSASENQTRSLIRKSEKDRNKELKDLGCELASKQKMFCHIKNTYESKSGVLIRQDVLKRIIS